MTILEGNKCGVYLLAVLAVLSGILTAPFFVVSSHAATFKLPDTGQTKCYEAVEPYAVIPCTGTGQDGAYSINTMSFTDNSNGTVTDNNTGLRHCKNINVTNLVEEIWNSSIPHEMHL